MYLILATKNQHKVEEFRRILGPLGIDLLPQDEICPDIEVEETGSTFAENARLKATAIYEKTGIATIADDSGLCVEALDGAPGVYSARYAGDGHDSAANNDKLLKALSGVPDEKRGAHFICAICTVFSEDDVLCCEGRCNGKIAHRLHGQNNFGYDPLFLVGEKSFAEIDGGEKDRISHRGNALRALYELLRQKMNKN